MACVGKQSSSAAVNLRGNYGIVVGVPRKAAGAVNISRDLFTSMVSAA